MSTTMTIQGVMLKKHRGKVITNGYSTTAYIVILVAKLMYRRSSSRSPPRYNHRDFDERDFREREYRSTSNHNVASPSRDPMYFQPMNYNTSPKYHNMVHNILDFVVYHTITDTIYAVPSLLQSYVYALNNPSKLLD
jgi:hypothetical protein